MVLGQHSGGDDVSPRTGLPRIDGDGAHDSRSTSFNGDSSGLVEVVCKDVFVISQRDDELYYQFAVAGYHCTAGAVVSVFPQDTVVDLVHANHFFSDYAVTGSVAHCGIEVLG